MMVKGCTAVRFAVAYVVALFSVSAVRGAARNLKPDPDRISEIASYLPEEPGFPAVRISNRYVWDRIAPKGGSPTVALAGKLLTAPIPFVDDRLYEKVYPWEHASRDRRNNMLKLVLAECIENKGRFLTRIAEYLDAISSQTTWVNPYHDRAKKFGNVYGRYRSIDLNCGLAALAVAMTLDLLKGRLPGDVAARAEAALRKLVFDVYLPVCDGGLTPPTKGCGWFFGRANWNVACHAYVLGAALRVVRDRTERARFIEGAERGHPWYFNSFTDDGFCTEGPSYWNYGFGQFLRLGLTVRLATGGKVDFFTHPKARPAVEYGFGIQSAKGVSADIGDCSQSPSPRTFALAGLVWPDIRTTYSSGVVPWACGLEHYTLYAASPDAFSAKPSAPEPQFPIRTFFGDSQVLISRPKPPADGGFAVFLKGGHNGVSHNHNDVGVYEMVLDGVRIVQDPGNQPYDLDTFGPKRYLSVFRNSYGHNVPYPAGVMQKTGRDFGARIVSSRFSDDTDVFRLDLAGAYADKRIVSLERTMTYGRSERFAEIEDRVSFAEPSTFESPVTTYGDVIEGGKPGEFTVIRERKGVERRLRLQVDAGGAKWHVKRETFVNKTHGNLLRFAIVLDEPVLKACVRLRFTPCESRVDGIAGKKGFKAHSMLTRDGRRMVSYTEGSDTVYELVPTNRLPADLPPIREWKLYGLKATHTDIGLHNPPYVQRHGTVRCIDEAARLVDADTRSDDDPAAYRYVMEGEWFWDNYHMDKGMDAAWRIVTNYVARGRMDVGVTCAGNHTHLFSGTEIERSTLSRKRLTDRWGIGTKTFIMADNPGISCSVIRPYVKAGIRYGIFLPNHWNPLPSTIWKKNESIMSATWNPDAMGGGARVEVSYDSPLPMVFRWKAPGSDESLLMWCSTQYGYGYSRLGIARTGRDRSSVKGVEKRMPAFLALLEKKYPYDVWLASAYGDDERPNTKFADLAADWNRKWAWPQFRTVGRLDEPFELLEKGFGDRIPVLTGEMTSGWLQHAASTPELLADKLNADRMLETAERLGTFAGTIDRAAVDRAWRYLVMNDEHSYGTSGYQGRRVFETWMQHRDWIERAAATASNELEKAERKLNLAPVRGKRVLCSDGVTENRWYRVSVTNGIIHSVYDKELERNLIDGPANRFLYTRDNHKTWETEPEKALGAKVTRRVFLVEDAKRIDIEHRFEHARDLFNSCRYYRYGYLAFPFSVPGGRFTAHLNGTVIRPYEDCHPMVSDAYCAVRDWCAVENGEFGVALMMRDSTLTEFGEIHPDKTCYTGKPPAGKTAIYPYLFTDWLQMHQPDGDSMNFTFRFSVTSYRGGWEKAGVPRLCAEWLDPHAEWMRKNGVPHVSRDTESDMPQGWTGLIEKPRAGHGEKDGQMYLLWGAEMSPEFSHYELHRDGGFLANVTNEVHDGIPYRVARYEDLGLPTHSRHEYRMRKVWKDGRKDAFCEPFSGVTRYVDEESLNGVLCEGEFGRVYVRYDGATVTSWKPESLKGREVFFMPEKTPWGKEVHGGLPICWPWFGRQDGRPIHGLVRYMKWRFVKRIGKDEVLLEATSTPETLKIWPHEFRLRASIAVDGPDGLKISVTEKNTGRTAYESAFGVHPYFAVADACNVACDGRRLAVPWVIERFPADGRPRSLEDPVGGVSYTVTSSGNDMWYLWNPGVERTPVCMSLGKDEWRRFWCLESLMAKPRPLAPGKSRTHEVRIRAVMR